MYFKKNCSSSVTFSRALSSLHYFLYLILSFSPSFFFIDSPCPMLKSTKKNLGKEEGNDFRNCRNTQTYSYDIFFFILIILFVRKLHYLIRSKSLSAFSNNFPLRLRKLLQRLLIQLLSESARSVDDSNAKSGYSLAIGPFVVKKHHLPQIYPRLLRYFL